MLLGLRPNSRYDGANKKGFPEGAVMPLGDGGPDKGKCSKRPNRNGCDR
jgi:hypothetical protein